MITTEVERDRYGRPLIKPIDGGKKVPYTRSSTVGSSLDDGFGLIAWKLRMAATGLTLRPDLLLAAASMRDNKAEMNDIVEKSMEAAGATNAARIGTALHALTEQLDGGLNLGVIPADYVADMKAYEEATKRLTNLRIEQFSVLDEYKIAGTADRLVQYKGETFISDIKTGSVAYPSSMAVQLAIYAHSRPYNIEDDSRGDWGDVNTEKAIIVHLPAGQGKCELHFIDIAKGWQGLQLAMRVREWRSVKGLLTPITTEGEK